MVSSILDIMLPKINGYEICLLLRKEKLDMPIIILTAKGEESDILLGLNLAKELPTRTCHQNHRSYPVKQYYQHHYH